MDHCTFDLPPEGSAKKENKLDCFEHKHIFCFKLQCAGIVYLLCTAIWWQIKRRSGPLHKDKLVYNLLLNDDLLLVNTQQHMTCNNQSKIFTSEFRNYSNVIFLYNICFCDQSYRALYYQKLRR